MLACMNVVPKQMNPWIIGLISQIYNRPKGILPMTFLVTIWSSGKGMVALMRALNRINAVMDETGYFRLRIMGSFYTIIILVILIATFILGVFGERILRLLIDVLPGIETKSGIVSFLGYVVMIVLVIIAFGGIYTYIPNKKLEFKKQIAGSGFVAVTWSIFTFGFSIYIEYFSGFTAYGTLGTIVLFLFWLYFCSYIMLMGAVINWFWEKICI